MTKWIESERIRSARKHRCHEWMLYCTGLEPTSSDSRFDQGAFIGWILGPSAVRPTFRVTASKNHDFKTLSEAKDYLISLAVRNRRAAISLLQDDINELQAMDTSQHGIAAVGR